LGLITLKADFDLHLALMGGQAFRWGVKGNTYRGVVGCLVLEVEVSEDMFTVQVLNSSSISGLSGDSLVEYVNSYFRVDENSAAIQSGLSEDSILAPLVRDVGVIRILRQDPWECMVSYICSIDSNIPKIRTNVASMCQYFGSEIALMNGGKDHGFPSIKSIADSNEQILRSLKVGFRAPYLIGTARQLRDEMLDFSLMETQSLQESRQFLQSFPGIGPKVADCILLYSLDRLDAFPIDRWVRRAVSQLYFGGQMPPDKEIREWAFDRFGMLSGYAQQYLFEWGRSEQVSGK
tara:strand:+ start:1720 stop:2595 length:876 start_codon:yes stop_codon:yes gene_type:complete